jgi:mannose-6-phosphate isomerase-like protein (cupin superfamily)
VDTPDGYEVRPHHHPMSEQVRVLEGTLLLGRGKTWNDEKLNPIPVGDEATVPAKEPHFIRARERTLFEVRSTGPFEITYINPADDPRKAPIQ